MKFNKSNKLITAAGLTLIALAVSGNVMAKGKFRGGIDRIDTDGSGTVELQEMIDASLAKVAKRFESADTDADGYISLEEYLAARRDGALDLSLYADEIVACMEEAKLEDDTIVVPEASDFLSPEDKFAAKDTDSDGFISLEEAETSATAKATEKFTALDTDADGSVTQEEMQAAREEKRPTRKALKACIDEVTSDDVL